MPPPEGEGNHHRQRARKSGGKKSAHPTRSGDQRQTSQVTTAGVSSVRRQNEEKTDH